MTTRVELPWGRVPDWPARCVACGGTNVVDTVAVVYDWGGDYRSWPFAHSRKVIAHAPTCAACADALQARLDRRRRRGNVYVAVAAAVAAGIVALGIGFGPGKAGGIAFVVLFLALLVPWALWEARRPLPIALEADRDGVTYEFADRSYAWDFARANGTTVRA